jgi:hypothetical protein
VLTGFNTDVEHDGVVYHVQTEDKGLSTPLILSLVYTGGAILASKRSPYQDLIDAGFDEAVLADRLKRQHRLICAAISAGRVEELKEMTAREATGRRQTASLVEPPPPVAEEFQFVSNAADEPYVAVAPPVIESAASPEPELPDGPSHVGFDSRYDAPFAEEEPESGLCVRLIQEREFYSGESLSLDVIVTKKTARAEKPVTSSTVSVKVLGSTFRPVLVSAKTAKDGIVNVKVDIPKFATGRAAILVRAVKGGDSVEIRRVVHPG